MDALQFRPRVSSLEITIPDDTQEKNQAAIRIRRLWCVLYCLSARGQGRRDVTCNMGLRRLKLASGDIFSDFSSAPRGENRFWLIGTITIRFMTREMLRKTGFVSRYVAEDAQRRVADRILANISSGLGHSYVSLRIYLFFTQKPTKLPLKSSLMDYWNGCCAEHPLNEYGVRQYALRDANYKRIFSANPRPK